MNTFFGAIKFFFHDFLKLIEISNNSNKSEHILNIIHYLFHIHIEGKIVNKILIFPVNVRSTYIFDASTYYFSKNEREN